MLTLTVVFALLAFVLAGGNRFTGGPLFIYLPDVSLLPPMSGAGWEQAFVLHQRNPLFVLCGSYQVSGMESLTVYKLLYAWVWLRSFSIAALSVCCVAIGGIAIRDAVRGHSGAGVKLLGSAVFLIGSYAVLRGVADNAVMFAEINVGQYRHAADVTFASLAVALLIGALLPTGNSDGVLVRAIWGAGIALDIAMGAMFEATDASVVWRTFPGYDGALIPGADRLFAFHPVWRNFTENPYLIQAMHRILSMALWIGISIVWLVRSLRGGSTAKAALLFCLLTAEGALGIATLELNVPIVLSIMHQLCAVLVLAVALAPAAQSSRGDTPGMSVKYNWRHSWIQR